MNEKESTSKQHDQENLKEKKLCMMDDRLIDR